MFMAPTFLQSSILLYKSLGSYFGTSSGSGAVFGAFRRNFIIPAPVALPARFLKTQRRSHYPDFLRDGGGDPLIEGYAVFFCQALRRFLDRQMKFEWVGPIFH
jgi:hypothetical protein